MGVELVPLVESQFWTSSVCTLSALWVFPGCVPLPGTPHTEHDTDVNTRGKDTTYVSAPPPPMSTPLGLRHVSPVISIHVVADQ